MTEPEHSLDMSPKRASVPYAAEQALRRSLEFQAAVELNMAEGLYTVDAQGLVTSLNPAAERLLGWTLGELRGKKMHDMTHYKHRDGSPFPIEECAGLAVLREGRSLIDYEDTFVRKDGTFFDVMYSSSPLRAGEESEIIGLVVVFRDITERKQLDAKLKGSERRYQRLFQTAKDGILILDGDSGKIIAANDFMAALVGLEPHEIVDKELFEIGMFENESENRAALRQLRDERYIRYEHLPIRNRHGEKVHVEFISNLYHEDETLVAQCNVRDITQRVSMEKKIQAQSEALANESRRKDEFLAMLSHELRNPLAPISAAVHLLRTRDRGGSENPIHEQAHAIIERQVANLTRLVNDLMEVSRALSGRMRLAQQVVDLNKILAHAIETVMPLIEERGHTIMTHLCEKPIWVNADPSRLEEVFVNLLNNAAKYTPDGGRLEARCEIHGGLDHAEVRVRDNGVGIDSELLPHIFDLFTQADRSLARSAGGLGIGLSLAHRIVEMHGGTLEAKSPPEDPGQGVGVGTEMIVRLARVPGPAETKAALPETLALKPDGLRILLIDDNTDLVTMLASSLRAKGYGVQVAHTGPEGLSAAQHWRPDIVLLDIGLPGLDGYEVARRLRADSTLGHRGGKIRLIALTGYGRETDIDLAREAGFDDHLTKPVEFKELEKMMATTR